MAATVSHRGQDGGNSAGSFARWVGCCAIPVSAAKTTSWSLLCWRLKDQGSSFPWGRQLISSAAKFSFRPCPCLFGEAQGVILLRFRGVSVHSFLLFLRVRQRRATAGHGRSRGEVPIRLRPSAGHHGAPNQEHTAKQIAHTEAVNVRLLEALNKSNEAVPVGYHAHLHTYMVRHPRKLTHPRRLHPRPPSTARQQPRQRPLKRKHLGGRHQPC